MATHGANVVFVNPSKALIGKYTIKLQRPGVPFPMTPGTTLLVALGGLCTVATAHRVGELGIAMHAVANVNDPLSHGIVGDGLLSLNEAIQLHNGTLSTQQLSPAEQSRITGHSADISWVAIDAGTTPRITVERDLDIILDTPHGLLIEGYGGSPVIDLSNSNVHAGFRCVSDLCSWRNLVIENGTFGIDLQQDDASFGGTVVDNVVFAGQSLFAFAVVGTSVDGSSRVLFDNCIFRNVPIAIRCDQQPSGRATVFGIFHSTIQTGTNGIEVRIGSGGQMICQLDSLRIDVAGTGIQLLRYPGSDRPTQMTATHLEVAATNCISCQCSPSGSSSLALRMLDLTAADGGSALHIWPIGADASGVVEDSRLRGDCTFLTGGGSTPLAVQNCRFRDGNVTIGTTATQPLRVLLTAFQGCVLNATGTAAIQPFACSVEGGPVQGATQSPLQFSYSYLGLPPGPMVTQISPLPSPPVGSFVVLPRDPATGSTLIVQAELPPGLFAIFAVGPSANPPLLLDQPVHLYLDLAHALLLPGIHRLQQAVTVPIPALQLLIGTEWVCQAVVFPDPGYMAPDMHLPPGRRFVLH